MQEEGDGDGGHDRDRGLGQKMGDLGGRADWLDPKPDVIALLPQLKARGARTTQPKSPASTRLSRPWRRENAA